MPPLQALPPPGAKAKAMTTEAIPKVAWEVEIHGVVCVVFAATKPKANWIAVKAFREAGWGRRGEWPRPKAVRAPSLDKSYLRDDPPRAYIADYVRDTV